MWLRCNLLPFAIPIIMLLHTASSIGVYEAGITQNTIRITRESDSNALYNKMYPNSTKTCDYTGRTLTLSIPIGLKPRDLFYEYNYVYQRSHELMVDQINLAPRCGVNVKGKHHPLRLVVMGADSDQEKTEAASDLLAPQSDVMMSPYSSGLAYYVSKAAHENNKVMFANGAVRPDVFEFRPASFGVLPSGYSYLQQILPLLHSKGAKSIYYVTDGKPGNFVKGLCGFVPDFAREWGLTLKGTSAIIDTGNPQTDFDIVARNLSRKELNPDILVSCIDTFCDKWIASLRRINWSPKALIITVCPGSDFFEKSVKSDAEYILGVSPWVPTLNARDNAVNWTAEEFADIFQLYSGQKATYHAASAAAQVSLAVQAMERADSLDTNDLARVLSEANATNPFHTVYGEIMFTDIGQADLKVLGTQYTAEGNLEVVAPLDKSDVDVIYPLPTWANRDCVKISPCGANTRHNDTTTITHHNYGGVCNPNGTCACQQLGSSAVSVGIGRTAACHQKPIEDMTYISAPLKAVGIAFMAVQLLASILFISWTLFYRNEVVVKISQPIFLVLVALGCMILILGIIPLSVEGEYRYQKNPITGDLTNVPNHDIWRADTACMAVPWLFGVGFVITFSALFAKIWRVRKLMHEAQHFRRVVVLPQDVAVIMVVLLVLEISILLAWQFVAPLHWEREVLATDENGYPTKSVGMCTSDLNKAFVTPYAVLNLGCLLYALYLCYITRNIPQKMNEGKWITASIIGIFQVLLLGIPILIIVSDDTNAYFFVRACLMFIVSMSVTCFIFFPKLVRLHGRPKGSRKSSTENQGPQAELPSGPRSWTISSSFPKFSRFTTKGILTNNEKTEVKMVVEESKVDDANSGAVQNLSLSTSYVAEESKVDNANSGAVQDLSVSTSYAAEEKVVDDADAESDVSW